MVDSIGGGLRIRWGPKYKGNLQHDGFYRTFGACKIKSNQNKCVDDYMYLIDINYKASICSFLLFSRSYPC